MQVDVLSPSKPMANVEALGVSLPGAFGYMEILENHAPMVSELSSGHLKIRKANGGDELHFFVAGGYVSVSSNEVKVLADAVETREEIDLERAEDALRRAKERLDAKSPVDLDRALEAVSRAEARLAFVHATS